MLCGKDFYQEGKYMPTRRYHASKLFNKFLKLIANPYLKHLFELSIDNTQVKRLKPPYIVLANHTNFWDPFLLSLFIRDPVYFLTSDAYFRSRFIRFLLKLVGAIPKTKSISDPSSIRAVREAVKNGSIIGIFPEGKRNWDGRTLPLLKPTAKLIKSLNIPVVSLLFKGAYLAMPRWASNSRKGRLEMNFSIVLRPQEIELLSVDEIFTKITGSLMYDEYEFQRKHMNPYTGRNLAEKLERFLFCCPNCKSIGDLTSNGDLFCCANCGYSVSYNRYGFFETDGRKIYFDNPRDWNLWQLEYMDSVIAEKSVSASQLPIIEDHGIILRASQRAGSLNKLSDDGCLRLYMDRVEYCICNEVYKCFPINEMRGLNVQFNSQLEFMIGREVYRFSDKDGVMNAYKWVMAIDAVKNHFAKPRY